MLLDDRDRQGWVLKALREAGNSLLSELHGLDDDALCRRPSEDEWCLKEIAAHVRDAEELSLLQMTSIIEQPLRPVPVWDVDVLPAERDYRAEDLAGLLLEFRNLRRETTSLLWSVSDRQWQRQATHPYRGEITLGTLARELTQHDLEHLWQVRRLKFSLFGAAVRSRDDDWP